MVNYETRTEALADEARAIRAERPLYNVVHNRGNRVPPIVTPGPKVDEWTFYFRQGGGARVGPLHLYGEIDCSSCVEDVYDQDGQTQFRHWLDYVRRHDPDRWTSGLVRIWWSIGGAGTHEAAPVWDRDGSTYDHACRESNFLHYYTWPRNAVTGERVDWGALPQQPRFPAFSEAAGPLAPFQRYYDLSLAKAML